MKLQALLRLFQIGHARLHQRRRLSDHRCILVGLLWLDVVFGADIAFQVADDRDSLDLQHVVNVADELLFVRMVGILELILLAYHFFNGKSSILLSIKRQIRLIISCIVRDKLVQVRSWLELDDVVLKLGQEHLPLQV